MARRFKKTSGIHGVFGSAKTSNTTLTRYDGLITLTDLLKKFGIPHHARIWVEGVGNDGHTKDQIEIDVDAPIKVSWTEVN